MKLFAIYRSVGSQWQLSSGASGLGAWGGAKWVSISVLPEQKLPAATLPASQRRQYDDKR